MIYYRFARRTNGTLKFICELNQKFTDDGYVTYSDEEIVKAKDFFTVPKMRTVKNGLTWLKYHSKN